MRNKNNRTVKYVVTEAKLHIAQGNNKLGKGIFSFATVPGNEDRMPTLSDGTILSNISGTCSKHCTECAKNGACYAWRDYCDVADAPYNSTEIRIEFDRWDVSYEAEDEYEDEEEEYEDEE